MTTEERREKERDRKRRWSIVNREKESDRKRRWRAANPGKHREEIRRWQAANREKARAWVRRWKTANPAILLEWYARRRAAKRGSRRTPDSELKRIYRYCSKLRRDGLDVVVDHVIPLAEPKGPGHIAANLQIITTEENAKKHARLDYQVKIVFPVPAEFESREFISAAAAAGGAGPQ
jgi:5-methylcytosine-specific restriction endonuclease McrA